MIRVFLLLYLIVFFALRVVIFYRDNTACADQVIREITPAKYLEQRSDRYDKQCISLEGRVVQYGSFLWDIFFIKSFQFKPTDGPAITFFTNGAVPPLGSRLTCTGVYRQFYKGSYFHWTGAVEYERTHHDNSLGPPPYGH